MSSDAQRNDDAQKMATKTVLAMMYRCVRVCSPASSKNWYSSFCRHGLFDQFHL